MLLVLLVLLVPPGGVTGTAGGGRWMRREKARVAAFTVADQQYSGLQVQGVTIRSQCFADT